MALRTVGARLVLEVAGYMANVKTATKGTKDFTGELDKAAKAGNLDAVASGMARTGLALGAAFAGVTLSAAKFDKQMSAVSAVTDAGAKDMDRLRAAALAAGKATSFSATEAAKAEEELAKAGLSTSEILGGALRGSLSLAAAGTLDLAEAADIAAKTMNVFNLKGKDVGHIADVLAASANKSATDVHEMGEALRMGGLAARNAGLSLEDTVGTLSAFADNALVGSDAGTSMKTMLQMLAAPTEKAASLMKELGIDTYDAQGQFVGVEKLAGILQSRLGDLTQEQRNAALATIFGADAMRAASVLYGIGADGVREYVTAVDDQGAATDVAAKKMDNLMGDVERLRGSLETLAIQAGSGGSSGLRTLVQMADRLVGSVSQIPAPVQAALTGIAGITGAALLASAAALKLREAGARVSEQLSALGPIGEKAAGGVGKVTVAVGRLGIALAATQVASAAFGKGLNPRIDAMAVSMEEYARTGQFAGEASRVLGDDMGRLHDALKDLDTGTWSDITRGIGGTVEGMTGLGNVMDDSLQKGRERLDAIDGALTQLVSEGKAADAAAAFSRIAAEGDKFGISVNELKLALPNYAAALDAAGKEAETAAAAQAKTDQTAKDMAASWQGAVTAGKALTDVFDGLNGAAISWAQAESALEAAIDDAEKAIGKKKEGIDAETEAGRRNRAALLDIVTATRDAIQAKYDETQSVEEAKKIYDEGRIALINSAIQAGKTKKEAEQLANQWLQMPKLVTTGITTPGLDAANNKIRDLIERVKRLKELAGATVHVDVRGPARATFRHGGVVEHAQSGLLREAAIYRPTNPAMYAFAEPATGGELFLPRNGDQARGRSLLDVGASWYGMSLVPRNAMRWTGAASAPAGPSAEQIGAAVTAHLAPRLAAALSGGDGDVVLVLDSVEIARANRRGERDLERRGG